MRTRNKCWWNKEFILLAIPLSFIVGRLSIQPSAEPNDGEITAYSSCGSSCFFNLHVDRTCIRILEYSRTSSSGLGHQLSELAQALHISCTHNAALKFDGFGEKVSRHGHKYSFVNELLGLKVFTNNAGYSTSHLTRISFNDTLDTRCGVVLEGNYKQCPGGDCFRSPYTSLLLDTYATRLRNIADTQGTWLSENPFRHWPTRFHVVWHVRLGDLELHKPGDAFYTNIYESVKHIFALMMDVRHVFIAEWSLISADLRGEYERILGDLAGASEFLELDVRTSMLHMMHANLLVGSGSSLPIMAAVFSRKTLYCNVKPKIGFNYLNEYVSDGLNFDESYKVVDHTFSILHKLCRDEELNFKLKSHSHKCESKSLTLSRSDN